MKMPLLVRRYTFPNGKHYRIQVRAIPCRFGGGTSPDCSTEGLHVHMAASMLDPLPITYRGMVTWPTRRRRHRR